MSTKILTTLMFSCLLIMSCSVDPSVMTLGQTRIPEVSKKSDENRQAPDECLKQFRDLFKYLQEREPDIVEDEQAQKRWLSKLMRASLAGFAKRAGNARDHHDFPSNQTFIGVWNNPTSFSILGSRHYDYRDPDNPDDNRAVIDVLYEWEENPDGNLNNQYPGEKSLRSFIFVHEDGSWKLDDIYTFTDEYASPESLRGYFDTNSRDPND